jgi:AmmeMemoRadiSam system protein B/AmmeMemoRadiSam system protein A
MKKSWNTRVLTFSLMLLVVLLTGCAQAGIGKAFALESKPRNSSEIRESVIAGSWYPSSAPELRRQVEGFLGRVPAVDLPGRLTTLISPHAGFSYSGEVAAHAYKLLEKQKFETVVIIAPSHHARFSGVSVYDRGGFKTPLGLVPLDDELIATLEKRESRIRFIPEAHAREHSLEIQLPFLQVLMPGFKLVPLVMGEQNLAACRWLSDALADSIRGKSVLIVASSDLSHYHTYDQAKQLDQVVLDRVAAFDAEGLSRSLSDGKCEACGGGPMTTAMLAARRLGATNSRVLHYADSGDVTGNRTDPRGVVGYMAAALWEGPSKTSNVKPAHDKLGADFGLTADEKAMLHRIARETIQAKCLGKAPPTFQGVSARLKEPRGAFVTLQKNGELRGCIGHIVAVSPLVETVSEMAVAAAFHDPRFAPLRADELKDLNIEISVLTPMKRVDTVDEIQVGVHGIYMVKGSRSGLLLPQVATEYGWDRLMFLENTCRKAGLPKDAWKEKETEIHIFSADVF